MKVALSIALLGLFVVAALARTDIPRKQFKFTPGKVQTYEYRGRLVNGIPKLANQYSGLQVECKVIVEPVNDEQCVMKLDNIRVGELPHHQTVEHYEKIGSDSFDTIYTQNKELTEEYQGELVKPIRFIYAQGKVHGFEADVNEAEWSINMKKSILALFQLDLTPSKIIKSDSIKHLEQAIEGRTIEDELTTIVDPLTGERIIGKFSPEDVISQTAAMPLVYPVYEESFQGVCETKYQVDSVENVDEQQYQKEIQRFNDDKQIVLNVTKTINFKNCLTDPSVSYDQHIFGSKASNLASWQKSYLNKLRLARYNSVPEEIKNKYSNVFTSTEGKDNVASPTPVDRYSFIKYNITQNLQDGLSVLEGVLAEGKIKYQADGDELVSVSHQKLKLLYVQEKSSELTQLSANKQFQQIDETEYYTTIQSEMSQQKMDKYQKVMRLANSNLNLQRQQQQLKKTTKYMSTKGLSSVVPPFANSASWYSLVADEEEDLTSDPEELIKQLEQLLKDLVKDVQSDVVTTETKKAGHRVVQMVHIMANLSTDKLIEVYERIVSRIPSYQTRQQVKEALYRSGINIGNHKDDHSNKLINQGNINIGGGIRYSGINIGNDKDDHSNKFDNQGNIQGDINIGRYSGINIGNDKDDHSNKFDNQGNIQGNINIGRYSSQQQEEIDLESPATIVSRQDETEEEFAYKIMRKLFLDSLPLAGTKQSIACIVELIENKRVSAWEAKELVESCPQNIRYPDKQILDAFVRLSQCSFVREHQTLKMSTSIACAKMIANAYARSKSLSFKSTVHEEKLPVHLRGDILSRTIAEEADPRYIGTTITVIDGEKYSGINIGNREDDHSNRLNNQGNIQGNINIGRYSGINIGNHEDDHSNRLDNSGNVNGNINIGRYSGINIANNKDDHSNKFDNKGKIEGNINIGRYSGINIANHEDDHSNRLNNQGNIQGDINIGRRYTTMQQEQEAEQLITELDILKYVQIFKQMLDKSRNYHDRVCYIETLAHMKVPQVLPVLEPYVSGRISLNQCLNTKNYADQWTINQHQRQQHQYRTMRQQRSSIDEVLDNKNWSDKDGKDAEECNFLRTVAIYACAHIARTHKNQVVPMVLPVFDNTYEPYQIRIAAFTVATLGDIDESTLERIASQLWREPSKQVASFVVGTLDTLANMTHPKMAKIAYVARKATESMPKEYLNTWRYSWLMGGDHYNNEKEQGLSWISELVKSNVSAIPRAGYFHFGHSHGPAAQSYDNKIELGWTAKGLEQFMEEYLVEEDGSLLASLIQQVFASSEDIEQYYENVRETLFKSNESDKKDNFAARLALGRLNTNELKKRSTMRKARSSSLPSEKLFGQNKQEEKYFSRDGQSYSWESNQEEPKLALFAKLFDQTTYLALDKQQMKKMARDFDDYITDMGKELIMGSKLSYVKMIMPDSMWQMVPSQIGMPVFITHRKPCIVSVTIDGTTTTAKTTEQQDKKQQVYTTLNQNDKWSRWSKYSSNQQQTSGLSHMSFYVHPKIVHSSYRHMFTVDQAQKVAYGVQTEKSLQVSLPVIMSAGYSQPKQIVSFALAPIFLNQQQQDSTYAMPRDVIFNNNNIQGDIIFNKASTYGLPSERQPLSQFWSCEVAKTFVGDLKLVHKSDKQQSWLGDEKIIRSKSTDNIRSPVDVDETSSPVALKTFEDVHSQKWLGLELVLKGVTDEEQFDWSFDMENKNQHRESGPFSHLLHIMDELNNRPCKYQEVFGYLRPDQPLKEPVYKFEVALQKPIKQQKMLNFAANKNSRRFQQRSSKDGASYRQQQEQQQPQLVQPITHTSMQRVENKMCFSTKPVKKCPKNYTPIDTVVVDVPFTCLPTNELPQMQQLVEEAQENVLSRFESMKVTLTRPVVQAVMCTVY